jgi:propanediol utilization protein
MKWLQSPSDCVSFFNKKKILQPGEYAAKPDLSGDVMEKGRVKFVMLRLPMASLKEKLGLGYQATGHKRRNA